MKNFELILLVAALITSGIALVQPKYQRELTAATFVLVLVVVILLLLP